MNKPAPPQKGVGIGGIGVNVAVGGTGVNVAVDGIGVDVAVGGTGVDVAVGGTDVNVGGTGVYVAVGGICVIVDVGEGSFNVGVGGSWVFGGVGVEEGFKVEVVGDNMGGGGLGAELPLPEPIGVRIISEFEDVGSGWDCVGATIDKDNVGDRVGSDVLAIVDTGKEATVVALNAPKDSNIPLTILLSLAS